MNYLSHAFHCKQRRAHINDINILNLLLSYITWGQHNIVLVVTTSTVLILICCSYNHPCSLLSQFPKPAKSSPELQRKSPAAGGQL